MLGNHSSNRSDDRNSSFLILVFPGRAEGAAFAGLDWRPTLLLAGAVVAYALVIPHVGFFAALMLFTKP